MDKRATRFIKLYPLYRGLEADLLFFVAVDTLFLCLTKGFTNAQVVSLTTIATVSFLLLQFPLLWLIRRMGNTGTIRFGAVSMLLSAILITFGESYITVAIGKICHEIAVIFSTTSAVALENTLGLVGREEEFVRVRTAGNTVYAVITMLISFVAGFMFNFDNYLPMYCCIGAAAAGLILTFFMSDSSIYNRAQKTEKKSRVKFRPAPIMLLLIVVYGLFYSLIYGGQVDGKLFFQNTMLLDFSEDSTTLIISFMLVVSRVVRVIANLIFPALYKKCGQRMGYILPACLALSLALTLFGSFIPNMIVKIGVMSTAYLIILFLRDPYNIYSQDVAFSITPKDQHQVVITLLQFSHKLLTAISSLGFTFLLLSFPLIWEMVILAILGVAEIIVSYILYRILAKGKTTPAPL